MNNNFRLVVLLAVLMTSGVLAANQLDNIAGIDFGGNMVGGGEILANFSFDYWTGNENGSEFILRLDFSSSDSAFAVDRGDFVVSGYVEKCRWNVGGSCLFPKTIEFECSDVSSQSIVFSEGREDLNVEDGEFYCYSTEAFLSLDEHDNVFLEIVPNVAIWPGLYNLSAEVYYLTDEYAPLINITNRGDFDRYYREGDNVLVMAMINDSGEIAGRWANVTLAGKDIFYLVPQNKRNEVYPFSQNTPMDIVEDDYNLTVYAEDSFGNVGNDSVVLKIDLSGPEVSYIPYSGVVAGNISLDALIVDEKSGVDPDSVFYRIREMNGSDICPESGVGTWDCYNSGWVSMSPVGDLGYNAIFDSEAAGLNGEYWIEIMAEDVLGNIGRLE